MRMQSMPERAFLKLVNFCLYRNNINKRQAAPGEVGAASIVFYDHACPLCRSEMLRLKARDRHERLVLLDINGPEFDETFWSVTRSDAAESLHVLTANREWLTGMSAIRHVYAQVGLGWLMAPTGWPLFSSVADLAYRFIAPNRFVISRWLGSAPAPVHCSNSACCTNSSGHGGNHHD